MKTIFLIAILSLPVVAASAGEGAPSNPRHWSPQIWVATMKSMPAGDIRNGEKLYQHGYCTSCHGDAGAPLTDGAPALAGQDRYFLYKALLDYQSGALRIDDKSTVMIAAASPMTEQNMADLAVYLESLPRPASGRNPEDVPGHELAKMCRGCHGASGLGGKNHAGPALTGLNAFYLKRQLKAFQDGSRHSEINGLMFNIMGTWSEQQIDDLVAYYSAL